MILPRFIYFLLTQRGPMTAPQLSKMTGSCLLLVVLALKHLERRRKVMALPGGLNPEQVKRALSGKRITVWPIYCPVSDA